MHPFARKLSDLRREKGISQRALADAMALDQTYLCAIEAGRKMPRDDLFVKKVVHALALSSTQESSLVLAAGLSQRRYVVPLLAREDEYVLVNKLMKRLGTLQPAQVAALSCVLDL